MPRLINRLPKYRKHRPSGLAVVTLDGRDHYLGKYGTPSSRREYDRLCGQHLTAAGMLLDSTPDTLTLVRLLHGFWKHAKEHYGPDSTETRNFATLIKRLRIACGKTLLVREFGPLKMKDFRQGLIDQGLSRTSINAAINRLRRMIKWGVENELVRPEILEALKCVTGLRYGKSGAKETEPVKPVPDALVDAVLPHVAPQIRAMIELQRVTGMRSGEVCQMRTADISTTGTVWTYTPLKHKTRNVKKRYRTRTCSKTHLRRLRFSSRRGATRDDTGDQGRTAFCCPLRCPGLSRANPRTSTTRLFAGGDPRAPCRAAAPPPPRLSQCPSAPPVLAPCFSRLSVRTWLCTSVDELIDN